MFYLNFEYFYPSTIDLIFSLWIFFNVYSRKLFSLFGRISTSYLERERDEFRSAFLLRRKSGIKREKTLKRSSRKRIYISLRAQIRWEVYGNMRRYSKNENIENRKLHLRIKKEDKIVWVITYKTCDPLCHGIDLVLPKLLLLSKERDNYRNI